MKYFYLITFLIQVLTVYGQSVPEASLNRLISDRINQDDRQTYVLIKRSPANDLLIRNQNLQLIRKVAEDYYIAKIVSLPAGRSVNDISDSWSVNDHWKETFDFQKLKDGRRYNFLLRSTCKLSDKNGGPEALRMMGEDQLYRIFTSYGNMSSEYLANDCVTGITLESLTPQTEAAVNDLNLSYNRISSALHRNPETDGNNVIVSVRENKYDTEDIDLIGKNVPSGISSEFVDNHATEMATIIAGAGNSFITGRGIATGAGLSSADFADIFPDTDEEYRDLSIDIQNHSYGTEIENFYGMVAEAYDQSAFNNKHLLHFFSSGNVGQSASTSGPYQGIEGFANLTGNFKSSKNTISVGSADPEGNVLFFSSRGPAYDGRVKPELVTYSQLGTSNSAAIVSGTAALLKQLYYEKTGFNASAALIKAILLNSASDIENPHVDYKSGYGNLNATLAIDNIKNSRFIEGTVSDGDTATFFFYIPENAQNFKMMLVWTDSAASSGINATALINDLDLIVKNDTDSYLPWVLDPNREHLNDPAQRGEDHLNVIEQVTIDEPTVGTYSVEVKGFDVSSASQDFALVYQFEIRDQFVWDYPVEGSNLPYDGESAAYLIWSSTYPDSETGLLEFSSDGGTTWETLDESVDLSQNQLHWEDLPTGTLTGILRMTIGNQQFLTDRFTLSEPQRLRVGFDCGDSLLFFWQKEPLALSYNLYNLQGSKMTLFQNTSDTSVLIHKNEFENTFMAIEPVLAEQVTGIRSFAFNYLLQGASCYFNSIFPEIVPETDHIRITTNVGTIFNLKSVIFERFDYTDWVVIGEVIPDSEVIEFVDKSPLQGVNIYRAVAVLQNNTRIVSDETDIHLLTTLPALVFPNPVEKPDRFSVFTRDFEDSEVIFELYNMQGARVYSEVITTDRLNIPTAGINNGVYLYRVIGSGIDESGKLVIK